MNKTYKLSALWMMCLVLFGCLSFTACDNGDDEDTNQYIGGINLNVFGPSPVARGGELRFLGSGMDKVTAVIIPGCEDITDIKVISSTEIRVAVPQTAEPGLVVLKTPKGEITTKTKLTFTEPIALEAMSPVQIKPGAELTISGEYLNLIQEIIFADEVTVVAEDFVSQSRKEIKVIVPAEAQTGKIILSDGAEIPNWIYSDGELTITLPSVEAPLDLTGKKPGEVITALGKDLDLVKKVQMPNGDEVEFEVKSTEEGETISFILPDNMTDGSVVMIPASGVRVAVATIGMALPSDVKATPATELRGGDVITLQGINMELITDIVFPGVEEAVTPDSQSATEVKVTMPAAAISGNLLLNTGSGASVGVAIETQKPEFGSYGNEEVALGADVIIKGKNLDLVAKIVFTGGGEVEVKSGAPTELTVAMPTMNVETGILTLHMANGETVEIPKLTINAPEFWYIPVLPGEGTELKGGEVFDIQVENGDKLTGVQVNGQNVQYIVSANSKLYINIPQAASKATKVTLISSNGTIDYSIDFIPATEIENIVMDEMRDLGSWAGEDAGGAFRLYKEDLVKAGFAVGAKLRFNVNAYAYTQIQISNANWGTYTTLKYDATEQPFVAEVDVTQELYDNIMNTSDGWSDTGFIIQGEGCIINKVSVWYQISLETTLWKGSIDIAGWSGVEVGAETMFIDAGLKEGMTLRCYFTNIGAEPKVKLNSGHWEQITNGAVLEESMYAPDANGVITVTVDKDTASMLTSAQGWGSGLIILGQDCTLTKITIE